MIFLWYNNSRTIPHVRVQDALADAPLPAKFTNVGPFPRMDPQVNLQRRPLREPFLAVLTDERPLARVDSLVFHQQPLLAETLPASAADVGFVPGVRPLVEFECFVVGQALPAYVAEGGLLRHAIVLPEDVFAQTGARSELAVAGVAGEGSRIALGIPVEEAAVGEEQPGEHEVFLAGFALVGHLPRVEILVFDGLDAFGEGGGAGLALEVLAAVAVHPHVPSHAFGGARLVFTVVAMVFLGGGMLDGMQGEGYAGFDLVVAEFASELEEVVVGGVF